MSEGTRVIVRTINGPPGKDGEVTFERLDTELDSLAGDTTDVHGIPNTQNLLNDVAFIDSEVNRIDGDLDDVRWRVSPLEDLTSTGRLSEASLSSTIATEVPPVVDAEVEARALATRPHRGSYPFVGSTVAPNPESLTKVETFDSITGWTGTTPTSDTTTVLTGTRAGTLTSTSGTEVTAVHALAVSAVARHFEVSFYVTDHTKIDTVTFGLWSNHAATSGYHWKVTPTRNGWHRVSYVLGSYDTRVGSATPARAEFVDTATHYSIGVKAQAGQTTSVTFDGVEGIESPLPRGAVMLTWDDNRKSIFDTAFREMQARGMPGTLYMSTNFMESGAAPDGGPAITWDDVKTMAEHGWAIGGHSTSHPYLGLMVWPDQIEDELKDNHAWLAAHGFEPRVMAYPHGSKNDTVATIARRWWDLNRLVSGATMPLPFHGLGVERDPEALPGYAVINTQPNILERVEIAAKQRTVLVLYGHSVGTGIYNGDTEISEADFREVLDLIEARGMDAITAHDLLDGGTKLSERRRMVRLTRTVGSQDMWLPPSAFTAHTGTPTLGVHDGWPVWLFPDDSITGIRATWTPPGGWDTYTVHAVLAATSATAGDFEMLRFWKHLIPGSPLPSATSSSAQDIVTSAGQHVPQEVRLGLSTPLPTDTATAWALIQRRTGGTLPGDVAFYGAIIRRRDTGA